jgi:hypothetical protein
MSEGVSESPPLLELLELLELLLESSPGSLGGGVVGNGWSVSAEFLAAGAGLGASGELGGLAGLEGSPGNGNCSAGEGLFAFAVGGVHGLEVLAGADWAWFWFPAGHGAAGGACWGLVCARAAAENTKTASRARDLGQVAIRYRVLA